MKIKIQRKLLSLLHKLFVISSLLLLMSWDKLFPQDKCEKMVYKDAYASIEKRVEDLVSRMTLEEKVYQLNQFLLGKNNNTNNMGGKIKRVPAEIGSLMYVGTDPVFRNEVQRKAMEESRLGIPIIFAYDVIHGYRTVYPISLAQACSWNPGLVKKACSVAAIEAKSSGVDWTFSPMVDVARDPRWGRVAEGYGEDPYTNAVFAVASIEGYQGTDLAEDNSIVACLKHYVGYGASEGGRDYVYTEISRQTLWDTYLPPFEAGVKAGVATIMSAFNDISGVPASANHYTLTEVLKEKWGYEGFVVSDWGSVMQLVNQGVADSEKEATAKAINAGVEMDMTDKLYHHYLADLVKEAKVPKERLDDAVKRILRIKFKMGLFENPYVPEKDEKERFLLPENLRVAEKLAEESIVLLKNEHQILPLKSNLKIAIIGPMANNKEHLLGSWSAHGEANDVVSIYEAMKTEFEDIQLNYTKGCEFEGTDTSGFSQARDFTKKSDVVILCLGEKKTWSGENASRASLTLPKIQEQLLFELKKVGKPIVLLLTNGRPLELNRIEPRCEAIIEMWQPGLAGGKPVAGVMSGRTNPSGKLAITFPRSTGQIPIYYNMRKSSRPRFGKYQDIPTEPFYEFGHGLSYSNFEYGELISSSSKIKRGEKITIEISVTNMGNWDGAETVLWFISDPVCSISRPVKELKYFEKQLIMTGETKIFQFEIDPVRDFSFVNEKGNRFLETGEFDVLVKDKKIKIEIID